MNENDNDDLSVKLENMRKSRDEFKTQATMLRETVITQGNLLDEQRELIAKLVNAMCDLSKAVKR